MTTTYKIADYWQRPVGGLIKHWDMPGRTEYSVFNPAANELCISDYQHGQFIDAWHLRLNDVTGAVLEYWDVLQTQSLYFPPGSEIIWGDLMAVGDYRSAPWGNAQVSGWERVDLQAHHDELVVCGHKHCDVIALAVSHMPNGSQSYRWVDYLVKGLGSVRKAYHDEQWNPVGTISVTKWTAA